VSESPPNDELRALIALEKNALTDPGSSRDRLATRLAPLFVPAPPPNTSPAGAGGGAISGWKLATAGLVTFALGGAAGAVIHASATPPRVEVRYVERLVSVDVRRDGGLEASEVPPVVARPIASPHATRPEPPRTVVSAEPTAPSSDEALARERQVIERARAALMRGDATGALAAVDEHSKAFSHGQLVEIREALAIQALVRAGRHDEARQRRERFLHSFPGSMYLPVIESAVDSLRDK
jgi:hypothetical protein